MAPKGLLAAKYPPPTSAPKIHVHEWSDSSKFEADPDDVAMWWEFDAPKTGWIVFDISDSDSSADFYDFQGFDSVQYSSGTKAMTRVTNGNKVFVAVTANRNDSIILKTSVWADVTYTLNEAAHTAHVVVGTATSNDQVPQDTTEFNATDVYSRDYIYKVAFPELPTETDVVNYFKIFERGALNRVGYFSSPDYPFKTYTPQGLYDGDFPLTINSFHIAPYPDGVANGTIYGTSGGSIWPWGHNYPIPDQVWIEHQGGNGPYTGFDGYASLTVRPESGGGYLHVSGTTWGTSAGYTPTGGISDGAGYFYPVDGQWRMRSAIITVSIFKIIEAAIADIGFHSGYPDGPTTHGSIEILMESRDPSPVFPTPPVSINAYVRPTDTHDAAVDPITSLEDRGILVGTFNKITTPTWTTIPSSTISAALLVENGGDKTSSNPPKGLNVYIEPNSDNEEDWVPEVYTTGGTTTAQWNHNWVGTPMFRVAINVPNYYFETPIDPPDTIVKKGRLRVLVNPSAPTLKKRWNFVNTDD